MSAAVPGKLSRRRLLGALPAAPLAAGLGSRWLAAPASPPAEAADEPTGAPAIRRRPRVAVVGAGAFGGWTALELLRGGAEVTLIDAWGPGNPRSSSGGESRVIRAVYGPDRIYVEWVRRAFERWEELEHRTGAHFYDPTGTLWMLRGDDTYVRAARPIMAELGFALEEPSLAEAARRWPQIDLAGVETVLVEPRSGVLAARRACRAVADLLAAEGGSRRTAHAVAGPVEGGALTRIELDDGETLTADLYVFACGPWLGRLFPEAVGERVRASRQEVYYFGTPAGSTAYGPDRMPVWIDFGERIFYGLPDVHGRGVKVADDSRGGPFDPDSGERVPTPAGIAAARRALGRRFPELAEAPLLESRVCQYENSPDGHLIFDRHPEAENLWLLGGGSGHGFKLGPAVGEYAARQVLAGEPGDAMFRLDRFHGDEKATTQFESRGTGR